MLIINIPQSPIQTVYHKNDIQLDVLREDVNHPLIQGNKFRKLKYNLIEAKAQNHNTLLTFGGAFSNHIHATAAAGKAFGFQTIGVIRGEELRDKKLNHTLQEAQDFGMKFNFVSREDYRQKHSEIFLNQLKTDFPNAYILPEGGTNELAVKGCEEILSERTQSYDFICVAMGTAGTISGIIKASENHQKILGFPALKATGFLKNEIRKYTDKTNYEIINAYHFGGYAKFSHELITFVHDFYAKTQIPLEPVYTGKLFYGVHDLIQKGYFAKGTKILAVHSGGLQGIKGFNEMHGNLINFEK